MGILESWDIMQSKEYRGQSIDNRLQIIDKNKFTIDNVNLTIKEHMDNLMNFVGENLCVYPRLVVCDG